MKTKLLVFMTITLSTVLLSSMLLVSVTSSSSAYNPWYDFDDDGDIDIFDIVDIAGRYGTSGTPYEGKAAIEHDSDWLNITDKRGQYFNITHNLNSTNIIVDLQGRTIPEDGIHQEYLGGIEPTIGWDQTYGGTNDDQAYVVIETGDGKYAIVGFTNSFGAGGYDSMLVKADASGELLWNRTYGGVGEDITSSAVQSNDGGYAMSGYTNNPSAGSYDFYLVKTDTNGEELWSQTYGGAGLELGNDMIQTMDGGYALCGSTNSFGAGGEDVWVVKTNASGQIEWSMTYGGSGNEWGYSIIQTNDGGYAIGGVTTSYGAGTEDMWLVKADTNGNAQWNRTFGGTAQDNIMEIIQTLDDGYALVGHTESFSLGAWDWWMVKTDPSGHHEWNRTFGGTGDERLQDLVQTPDFGYILCGYTSSFGAGNYDFWLIKTDAVGNAEWNHTYGGSDADRAYHVVLTHDGGYAIVGRTQTYGLGIEDFWLVKTDADGNTQHGFKYGLAWTSSTNNTITLYRGSLDPYWNYIRIRIWKIKE